MTSSRQLHLGAFMRQASIHTGAWRYPGAWPDMNFNFAHMKRSCCHRADCMLQLAYYPPFADSGFNAGKRVQFDDEPVGARPAGA
jgi:hypothetical protein